MKTDKFLCKDKNDRTQLTEVSKTLLKDWIRNESISYVVSLDSMDDVFLDLLILMSELKET